MNKIYRIFVIICLSHPALGVGLGENFEERYENEKTRKFMEHITRHSVDPALVKKNFEESAILYVEQLVLGLQPSIEEKEAYIKAAHLLELSYMDSYKADLYRAYLPLVLNDYDAGQFECVLDRLGAYEERQEHLGEFLMLYQKYNTCSLKDFNGVAFDEAEMIKSFMKKNLGFWDWYVIKNKNGTIGIDLQKEDYKVKRSEKGSGTGESLK